MKKIFGGIIVIFFVLAGAPSEAKSIWLKCGDYTFNLDSDKQQFNTLTAGKVIQGKAVFFPNQINFEVHWFDDGSGGGLRSDFSINRKTLEYTQTAMKKMGFDKQWAEQSGTIPAITSGVCKIITNPTQGNKI